MMKGNAKVLVQVSLLVAMEILLSRFCSIATPLVKIGFGFVPIAICGMLFGPVWAGIAGALADFLGAVLFPIGAYFPGFTLSAALTGVVFGLLLYQRAASWVGLCLAVGINCLVISLLLSTFWLTLITGTGYLLLLPTRLAQNAIMIPIQIVVLRLLHRPVQLYAKKRLA